MNTTLEHVSCLKPGDIIICVDNSILLNFVDLEGPYALRRLSVVLNITLIDEILYKINVLCKGKYKTIRLHNNEFLKSFEKIELNNAF